MYHYGRDNRFRPIIVLKMKLLNELGLTNDEIKLTIAYFIEYMLSNAILPGQVENWIIITDMKGVGLTNVPYSVSFTFWCFLRKPNFCSDAQRCIWIFIEQLQSQIVQRLHCQRSLVFYFGLESLQGFRRGNHRSQN